MTEPKLEEETIDDRPAFIAYFDEEMELTDAEHATVAKVIFQDNGETMWLYPDDDDDNDKEDPIDE